MTETLPFSVDSVVDMLRDGNYVADRSLSTALYLALKLGRPLFLEGEAGVGKTEIGKVLSESLGRRLIRITSNRTREIHDAIKRRCFYFWVDYPDAKRELEILKVKVPDAPERLTQQVVDFVQHLRNRDLFKLPGVAETIDWTNALIQLDKIDLDPETVNSSLGVLLKYQDDIEKIQGSEAAQILDEVKAGIAAGN
ncbi:MAG: hypothetical protein EBU57_11895 [Alphaproteobacteria bacterium]|nr:hypothetical protein [Alphaproteobacteria bacterium]